MTQPTSTIVYVTTGTEKLTQPSRRNIVSKLADKYPKSTGTPPTWVGQARLELQPGNSFSMPVGWIGIMVVDNKGGHYDRSYAVASYPVDEKRIAALGLRTALIDTFMDDDVAFFVSNSEIASVCGSSILHGTHGTSPTDDWEVVGPHCDVVNECKRLIQMRTALNRKTGITNEPLVGCSDKLREMTEHVNQVEHGVVDSVIYDGTAVPDTNVTERVYNAADQMGVVLSTGDSKPQPKSVTATAPKVNVINKIIGSAIAKHRSSTSRDGKSSLSIICSSCMRLVRITYDACVAGPSIRALTTTHCKGCAVKGSSVVALTPILVQNLIGYNLLQQDENTKIAILKDGEYVKHVDAEAVFRALTTDHSIGSMSYEDKRIVELRGGFF